MRNGLVKDEPRPSTQHDALEFLLYLLRQANVADKLGEWQARRQEDGEVGVVDRGVHVQLVLPRRRAPFMYSSMPGSQGPMWWVIYMRLRSS